MPRMDDDDWPDFPVILGFGGLHDLRGAEDGTVKSRLWGLRSTSRAACAAYDRPPKEPRARRVGFYHRRPK